MQTTKRLHVPVAVFAMLASAAISPTAELKRETRREWDQYTAKMRAEIAVWPQCSEPFQRSDATPDVIRRIRAGEIVVTPVGRNPKPVAGGLIHHWAGAAFMPYRTIDDVFSVIRDYDRYKEYYAPLVINSKMLGQSGNEYRFSMRMMNQSLFSKSALNGEYAEEYHRVSDRRWYSVAYSTRMQQIDDFGRPSEHMLPPDEGSGYIWRVYSISRYEQRDSGVYVEVEFIALSRDIPASLRWLVNPIIRRVSRNALLTSLEKTRAAVGTETPAASYASGGAHGVRQTPVASR